MPVSEWSFTVTGTSATAQNVLVVCGVAVSSLGIDDLAAEVAAIDGPTEATRWRRARAQEFAIRLRDMLARHLSDAELLIRIEDDAAADRVRVVFSRCDDEALAGEQALIERVQAISDRTWATWSEQLRITMRALREIGE